MNYTQKLTLSMVVQPPWWPGRYRRGARRLVAPGKGAHRVVPSYHQLLLIGGELTALLTAICVGACIGFTVWIRRTAKKVLGATRLRPVRPWLRWPMAIGGQHSARANGSLLHSLQRLATVLQSTLGDIRNATQSISVASTEIASGNLDLSVRTEQTASNLQRTASRMEQLTSTVEQSRRCAPG